MAESGNIAEFTEYKPTLADYWRSIILFGRNVASYKFALGKSLLELSTTGKTFVTLADLAEPFSTNICEHLNLADTQGTSKSSKFLDACRGYNAQKISKAQLLDTTVKHGFNNVIDAFHRVQDADVESRFFSDERKSRHGISLSDNLLSLVEEFQFQNLGVETEARWRLVETAWDLKLPAHSLAVQADDEDGLYVQTNDMRRRSITGCRGALNGYQKGKCFYCFANISVSKGETELADVDHFFPHTLKQTDIGNRIDGVWNLVLACSECNRGEGGKFALVPELPYLQRLHKRNNFLISSHHPLRETMMKQTGDSETERRDYLQSVYNQAVEALIHTWRPKVEHERAF